MKVKIRVKNDSDGIAFLEQMRAFISSWNKDNSEKEGYRKKVSVYGRLGKNNNPNKIRTSRIPLDIAKDLVIYVTNVKR